VKVRYLWPALRRWWWVPALAALVAGTTGYGVSSQLPKVYEGRARLQVTPAQVSQRSPDYNTVLGAEELTRTYAEMLRTRTVIGPALGATGIRQQYEDALPRITVTALRDTQLIEIRARADDSRVASELTNALADTFVQQIRADQAMRFAASKQALGQRLDQLAVAVAARGELVTVLRTQPASAERDAELAQAESELAQVQPSYAAASQSYQDVMLAEVRDRDLLDIVERATPALSPVEPKVPLIVALAALAGLVMALGIVTLMEGLDDSVSSAERLRSAADLPRLGSLALLPPDTGFAPDARPDIAKPHAHATELFRSLLVRLRFELEEGYRLQVLLVTGCEAGAGTTTVATGLARTAAHAGQRVVLVDADLRPRSRNQWCELPTDVGLASVLANTRLSAPRALFRSPVPGLWLLPSGPPPPDPTLLLASPRAAEQLRKLREVAELIVIDAAPTLAMNDAALLAPHADATLLVVDARRTHAHEVRRAATLLRETGAHLVGAMLNRVPLSSIPIHDYPAPRQTRPVEWLQTFARAWTRPLLRVPELAAPRLRIGTKHLPHLAIRNVRLPRPFAPAHPRR
jgi:capsular exopolysaccharide synthesis family protein